MTVDSPTTNVPDVVDLLAALVAIDSVNPSLVAQAVLRYTTVSF